MNTSEASEFARGVAKMACEDRDAPEVQFWVYDGRVPVLHVDAQSRVRRRRERPFVWLTSNHARLRDPEHREREGRCLRRRLREAGIKELGFAIHAEGDVHGYAIVLRAGDEHVDIVECLCAESIREAFASAD